MRNRQENPISTDLAFYILWVGRNYYWFFIIIIQFSFTGLMSRILLQTWNILNCVNINFVFTSKGIFSQGPMAFHCFNMQKYKHVKLTGRGRYLLRDYRTKFSSCKFRAGISHEIRWRDPRSVFLERARATHQFLGNYVVDEDEYQIAPQAHPSTVTSVMFNSILSLSSNIVWKLILKIFNTWVLFQFLFTC